jgi:hypothetical protein
VVALLSGEPYLVARGLLPSVSVAADTDSLKVVLASSGPLKASMITYSQAMDLGKVEEPGEGSCFCYLDEIKPKLLLMVRRERHDGAGNMI